MTPVTDRVKFARRLIYEMDRARIETRHLAAVTHIPVFVINRWRDGQGMPTPRALEMLCAALGVPSSAFIDR